MEIPFKRIAWNEHETALLIEDYEKVRNGSVHRSETITQLSKRLRGPMLKDGAAISEKYRNVAGIDLQLNVIECYMSGGNNGFGSGSIPKTFEKIILLKMESPTSFKNLLDEANLLYPAIQEARNDVAKSDEDTGMVSDPEVKITPTMTSLFDWNKYEATLIVNLYNQILNESLIETEACDLVMKRFFNCSPIIDRDVLPCQNDLSSALSDVSSYEKGILREINNELELSLELYESNELTFRELLDSAMKLYPLKSIVSFFDQNSKKKESDNKVDSKPTISIEVIGNDLVVSDFPEQNNNSSTNTITEEEQKAYIPVNIVETKEIKETKQKYKPRKESIIDIFRDLLDSAMKLYPLKSIVSSFDQNSKKKESDNKVDSKPTISIEVVGNDLVVSDFPEQNNYSSTNTITEEEQKAYIPVNIVETKEIKETKQKYKPRRKSIIDIANASLKKDDRYTIDDFYTIKNKIYHIVSYNDFWGSSRRRNPSFYSIIVKSDGQKYVIWHVGNYDCDEVEVIELLNEYAAYKARYISKSFAAPKKSITNTGNTIKKVYTIPAHNNSNVVFYGLKLLTLRARSTKKATDYAFSKGISKVIPVKLFVGTNGKACHAIPLENFIPNPKDGDYMVKQNPYGVDFAVWYVDVTKSLTNDDVLDLVKESIRFNTLKPDSYIETEPKINAKAVNQKVTKTRLQPNMKIKTVLVDNYKNGYRMGSNMDRKRFVNFYKQKYTETLTLDGESLDKEVAKCGIVCAGNKLYVPEEMLNETIKNDLFDYINRQFNSNLQYIYYNVLFNEFSDKFLGQKILDGSMLHSYLEFYYLDEDYNFEAQYFSKDSDFSLDVNSEVIKYVKEQGRCVYETEVVSAHSFIPEVKVRESFNGNKNILLTAGKGKRFHISNFQLEIEDKQVVIDYLSREIKDLKFVSFIELLDKLKLIAPRVVDNNVQFTDTGIRSALSILLNDLFYVKGGIISDIKNPISLQDAFVDFARGRSSFTVEEAQLMAGDFATLINFEALAIHNIRVSDELYISKDSISFPVDNIDNAIEMFCNGDFISISDVSTFAAFPECGYNWNKFLLESYIYNNSRKFCLYHNRFNKTSVSGAIVRKSAKYNNYNEVLANALSNTDISLEKKSVVLKYLFDTGFIASCQLDGIDQVIYRAKRLKN